MINEQVDKLGQIIEVGDIVAIPDTKRMLSVGTIIRLTPKGAKVLVKENWINNEGNVQKHEMEVQKPIGAIVKINPEVAFLAKLKGDI